MQKIRLTKGVWKYNPHEPLGPEGGFGIVFAGESAEHGPIAVKRLKVTASEAAHRELRIADDLAGRELHHVVPVLDSGQDAESEAYFVVMARAERSLQSLLDEGNVLDETEAGRVLLDVVSGLEEVGDIVHRDLKPGNVLLHDGVWKVADFGIAKFVEESTSVRTLKECLTPHYAAPEQWRLESPSSATDLYALGCIGYAILTGRPPFHTAGLDEIREAHLHASPPPLDVSNPQLRSLLSMLLRKNADARPSRTRIKSLLAQATQTHARTLGGGIAELAQAGAHAAVSAATDEAERELVRDSLMVRQDLASEGVSILRQIIEHVLATIMDALPNGSRVGATAVQVGNGRLSFTLGRASPVIDAGMFAESGWDVVTGAKAAISQSKPQYEWSSSLWYARRDRGDGYRWWEVAYQAHALAASRPKFEPFALDPGRDADQAMATILHSVDVAFDPRAIDDEHLDEACERWAGLLAKAVRGELGRF